LQRARGLPCPGEEPYSPPRQELLGAIISRGRHSALCNRQVPARIGGAQERCALSAFGNSEAREHLKGEISNLAWVIAAGRHSPALLAELEKRNGVLRKLGTNSWPPMTVESTPGLRRSRLLCSAVSKIFRNDCWLSAQNEGRTRKALHGDYSHSGREKLQAEWGMGFGWGCTFGWCRGPESNITASVSSFALS
jgi:hypothetical protein